MNKYINLHHRVTLKIKMRGFMFSAGLLIADWLASNPAGSTGGSVGVP